MMLHEGLLDPLWMEADRCGIYKPESHEARIKIRKAARSRVYRFLAHKLGINYRACHTGGFDIETCRRAWVALRGVTYLQIRQWGIDQRAAEAAKMEAADA